MKKEEHNQQLKSNAVTFFYTLVGAVMVTTMIDFGLMSMPDYLREYVMTGTGIMFLWLCYNLAYLTINLLASVLESIFTSDLRSKEPEK